MDIIFETPPPDGRTIPYLQELSDALRARPGEWARVPDIASPAFVTRLKRGDLVAFPPGEFEATSRKQTDGSFQIFVRYRG